jgi:hypothetical protein
MEPAHSERLCKKTPGRDLHPGEMGFRFGMNATTKLELIRDLVKSKMLALQPFAGEEMTLPDTDPRRDGFVDGERTLAAQVLRLIDEGGQNRATVLEPLEDEMVLGR